MSKQEWRGLAIIFIVFFILACVVLLKTYEDRGKVFGFKVGQAYMLAQFEEKLRAVEVLVDEVTSFDEHNATKE